MNKKKLYRLKTEERLTVRRRNNRKLAMGSRTPMTTAGKALLIDASNGPQTAIVRRPLC